MEPQYTKYQFTKLQELARRARFTGFVYPVLFLIAELSAGAEQKHLAQVVVGFVFFLLIASVRAIIATKLDEENQANWKKIFFGLILLAGASWGAFSGYAIVEHGIGTATLLILFASGGIAAGSLTSLGFSLRLIRLNIVFLLLPMIIGLFVSPAPTSNPMGTMVSFFLIVLFLQAKGVFKDLSALLEKSVIIEEQNKELLVAKTQALEAIKAKTLFLANMSHEIRTPMNGIVACTEFLQEKNQDDESMQLLDVIKKSGDTLLVLINDILEFSKIESQKLVFEKESFDLHLCVQNVVELMQVKAQEEKVKLSFHIDESVPQYVKSDITRLRQVLSNLVSNGVKFTDDTVKVCVESVRTNEGNHDVIFSISDNGDGISEEDKSKLFKNFSQLDSSSTRNYGGTGLGLAICKGITEGLGGKVWIDSKVGQGTKFYFVLPLEEGEKVKVQTSPKFTFPVVSAVELNILVAEDNPVNQMVIKKMLAKLGHAQVDTAKNGTEALEAAKNKTYDIIFMDQHMPQMDGIVATKKIRERGINTPIYAVTASVFEDDKKRCLEVGMNGFLTKPLHVEDVASVLDQFTPDTKKSA